MAASTSTEQEQAAISAANRRGGDIEWQLLVDLDKVASLTDELYERYARAQGTCHSLIRAMGVAEYVLAEVKDAIDKVHPKVVGGPRVGENGLWRDGGMYVERRKALLSVQPLLQGLYEGQQDQVEQVEHFFEELDALEPGEVPDEESLDYRFAVEQAPEMDQVWADQLLQMARRAHEAQRDTMQAHGLLMSFPTKPEITKAYRKPKYVYEQPSPQALEFPFKASQSERNRGVSPPTLPPSGPPTPTPLAPQGSGNDVQRNSLEQNAYAEASLERLDYKKDTPCEYFDRVMRYDDPILLTYYSIEAIDRDFKYWHGMNPPQMPTMNAIFPKRMYPDWTAAFSDRPVHTSDAIRYVVDNSLPVQGLDASWRSERAGERAFVVDGTNLFYDPDSKDWDRYRRILAIKSDRSVPEGQRYGPVVVIIQSHLFENNLLKYGDSNATTYLSDTGIRLMHDLFRPLHGGHDYPIHIIEICAELYQHTQKLKRGADRFPCIDMQRDARGKSVCRLLLDPAEHPETHELDRRHKYCEYDDCVGTLVKQALEARNMRVEVITGEGGEDRAKGIRQYLKSPLDMDVVWGQMRQLRQRVNTRVYRVGYNRVVRNWVLLKLGEEEEPGSASP
jgi:hypothetical protein